MQFFEIKNSNNFEKIENQIQKVNSSIKIFRTFYKISNIQKYDLDSKYLIFSGIGNPSDFKDILLKNRFDVAREVIFPDHYEYSSNDFEKIKNNARNELLKNYNYRKRLLKT